jgi:hypothetical protein
MQGILLIHSEAKLLPLDTTKHVWTQGMILGRFQGNWHVLVPIGGATFDTARSPACGKKLSEKLKMLPKFTGPYFMKTNFYTHTANSDWRQTHPLTGSVHQPCPNCTARPDPECTQNRLLKSPKPPLHKTTEYYIFGGGKSDLGPTG